MDVLGDLAVGAQRAGDDDGDVVLAHHVADPVADAGLEARVGDRREAPQGAVVVGGLLGVADPELDVVDAVERQEVLRLRVGVLVDVGAGLVGGALVAVSRRSCRSSDAAPVLRWAARAARGRPRSSAIARMVVRRLREVPRCPACFRPSSKGRMRPGAGAKCGRLRVRTPRHVTPAQDARRGCLPAASTPIRFH